MQHPWLVGKDFARRDQEAGTGVGEQVLDLPWPEGLVHEHGDRADRQRGEERGGRVAATLQEDRDGIVRRDAGGQ